MLKGVHWNGAVKGGEVGGRVKVRGTVRWSLPPSLLPNAQGRSVLCRLFLAV